MPCGTAAGAGAPGSAEERSRAVVGHRWLQLDVGKGVSAERGRQSLAGGWRQRGP